MDAQEPPHDVLYVRNITGTNGEKGFRLFWSHPGAKYATPALGYATSSPFKTRREAVVYGLRMRWGKAASADW